MTPNPEATFLNNVQVFSTANDKLSKFGYVPSEKCEFCDEKKQDIQAPSTEMPCCIRVQKPNLYLQ